MILSKKNPTILNKRNQLEIPKRKCNQCKETVYVVICGGLILGRNIKGLYSGTFCNYYLIKTYKPRGVKQNKRK